MRFLVCPPLAAFCCNFVSRAILLFILQILWGFGFVDLGLHLIKAHLLFSTRLPLCVSHLGPFV